MSAASGFTGTTEADWVVRVFTGFLIGLFLSLAPAPGASAQTPAGRTPDFPAALRGDAFRIESTTLGRGFDIYVRLPENYDPEGPAYPVIYLLDGDSLFPILAANHLFLHYDDRLPEAVVVGIAYGGFDPSVNRRNVDFQSPGDGVPEGEAGAEAFLGFMRDELMPRIEGRFHVDPERRVLFGQSRGGNLVLYSAVRDPDLFWGRVASNPSLTPGLDSVLAPAERSARDDLRVVVTSGTRDRPDLREEAALWVGTWQGRDAGERPWTVSLITIEGGTHAANAADAYRQAMNLLFSSRHP
jgi:predicted alpha/beta superfamily hydrolase